MTGLYMMAILAFNELSDIVGVYFKYYYSNNISMIIISIIILLIHLVVENGLYNGINKK